MPNITPYSQHVNTPVPGGLPNTHVRPVDISGFTAGMGDAIKAFQGSQEEKGRAWAVDALSQARLHWSSHLYERQANAKDGAENFTKSFVDDFNAYTDKAVEAAPTPYAKEYMKERMFELRTFLGERALAFEAEARIDYRENKFESSIENTKKLMNVDPDQFAIALAEELAVIDSAALPPKRRATMRQKAIEEVAGAAVWSQINKDPAKFLESIKMHTWGASGPATTGAAPADVPVLYNPDGTISTERTITVESDGKHYLIPTIVDGKAYGAETAIDMWSAGKNKPIAVFDSAAEADKYARERSAAGGKLSVKPAGVVGDPANRPGTPTGLQGVTGNKPFDILPFDKRLHMLSEALTLKNRIDSETDKLAERERKAMAESSMKEAWFRLDAGKLTKGYIEEIRPLISDSEYHSLLTGLRKGADGSDSKSDPETFGMLQNMLYVNPQSARSNALTFHRQGRLTNSDLSAILTKANELDRQGGPKTEFERTRARIVGNLDPGPMVQDPIGRGRLAEALYTYDSWAEIHSRGNARIPDKEIAKRGEEIINQYRFINLSSTAAGLPKPRFGDVRRNPGDPAGMLQDIARAWSATKQAYDSKKISKEEYHQESQILNNWRKLATQEKK